MLGTRLRPAVRFNNRQSHRGTQIYLPSVDDHLVHQIETRAMLFLEGCQDKIKRNKTCLREKLIHVGRHQSSAMAFIGRPQNFAGNGR